MRLSTQTTKIAKEAMTREMLSGQSIVLVGMMAVGKTTIGRALHVRLGIPFVDSDHRFQKRQGMTVRRFFERFGEEQFRIVEARVIEDLLEKGSKVLATGDGAFMSERVQAAVRSKAISVWLKANPEIYFNRTVNRRNRPLLNTGDHVAVLHRLIVERYPRYATADIVVSIDDRTIGDIAEEILVKTKRHIESVSSRAAVVFA
jgi:shikimate kinase